MALKQIRNIQSLHSITSKNGSNLVWIEEQSTFIHSGPTVQLLNIIHTNIQNIHISCEGSYSRIKATQNRKKRMQLAIKSSHTANCLYLNGSYSILVRLDLIPNSPISRVSTRQDPDRRAAAGRVQLHCTAPGFWTRREQWIVWN